MFDNVDDLMRMTSSSMLQIQEQMASLFRQDQANNVAPGSGEFFLGLLMLTPVISWVSSLTFRFVSSIIRCIRQLRGAYGDDPADKSTDQEIAAGIARVSKCHLVCSYHRGVRRGGDELYLHGVSNYKGARVRVRGLLLM